MPFTFTCPHCKTSHSIPSEHVPEQGAWGRCHQCKGRIFVNNQGAFREPPEAPLASSPQQPSPPVQQAEPPAPEGNYLLHTPGGPPLSLTADGVRQRIRARRAYPWDQISEDGINFHPLNEDESFKDLFSRFTIVTSKHCVNHHDKVAVSTCIQCSRGYCAACSTPKQVAHREVIQCPACWATMEKADLRWLEKPFWKQLDRVFLYPVEGMSWVTTLGVGILFWFGKAFIPFSYVFYLLGFAYVVHVISTSSSGKKAMDSGPDYELGDLISRGLIGVVVTLAIWIPIVLINFFFLSNLLKLGPPGFFMIILANIPLVIAGILYYPMALGMVAVWDNKWIAFRPDFVVEHILKIKLDYTAVLVAMIITWVISALANFVLGFIPILGGMVAGIITSYFTIAWAYCLGWTLYLNESKLGWD